MPERLNSQVLPVPAQVWGHFNLFWYICALSNTSKLAVANTICTKDVILLHNCIKEQIFEFEKQSLSASVTQLHWLRNWAVAESMAASPPITSPMVPFNDEGEQRMEERTRWCVGITCNPWPLYSNPARWARCTGAWKIEHCHTLFLIVSCEHDVPWLGLAFIICCALEPHQFTPVMSCAK